MNDGNRSGQKMAARDWALSMRISRRGRNNDRPLRSLLVHRLSDDVKAVYRVPLSRQGSSVHCEPCQFWFDVEGPDEDVTCPRCDREYEMEFAVYREVIDDEA